MKYKIVTCFDEKKLKKNAFKLLNEFKENWEPDIEFHCYYYNLDISNYSLPQADNIKYHKLENIEEYSTFVEENKKHNGGSNKLSNLRVRDSKKNSSFARNSNKSIKTKRKT